MDIQIPIPSPILKMQAILLKKLEIAAKIRFIKGHKVSNTDQNKPISPNVHFGEGIEYRMRLSFLVDVLWLARDEYSLTVFNFIASLLIEEAKAGMSVRIEPGPGIVSIELFSRFVRVWCNPREVQQILIHLQSWMSQQD